ncbi:MAG: TetR/AcrR family transcriptional regulator, partial [Novosphingobium sp.]
RAEVTEAQIFRCFTSKGDLFRTAIFAPLNRHFTDHQARRTGAEDAVPTRQGAREFIAELQDFIGEHSGMLMSLAVAKAYAQDPTEGGAGLDGLTTYFERGAGMMRSRVKGEPTVAPELMVRVSFAAVLGCVLFSDWLFPPGVASAAEFREATLGFMLDGLNANNDYI